MWKWRLRQIRSRICRHPLGASAAESSFVSAANKLSPSDPTDCPCQFERDKLQPYQFPRLSFEGRLDGATLRSDLICNQPFECPIDTLGERRQPEANCPKPALIEGAEQRRERAPQRVECGQPRGRPFGFCGRRTIGDYNRPPGAEINSASPLLRTGFGARPAPGGERGSAGRPPGRENEINTSWMVR